MTGEEALLAAALGAPAIGTLAALGCGSSVLGRRLLHGAALISAGAWAGLLNMSSAVHLGAFHSGPLVAAPSCAAALLLVSVDRPRTGSPSSAARAGTGRAALVATGLALLFLEAAFAGGSGGGDGRALVGGLAAATFCVLAASWEPYRVAGVLTSAAAVLGVGATAIGFLVVHDKTNGWLLPAVGSGTVSRSAVVALMVGAAGLCVAGGLRPGRSTVILLAGGLGVGVRAGPLLGLSANVTPAAPGTSEGLAGLVLALAVLAVVAALLRKPPLAMAILALAVAAGPLTLLPASRLLAAGAVLALAIDRPPAWFLVVPGGAALVVGAIDAGSALAVACVGVAVAVGAVLAGEEFLDRRHSTGIESQPFDVMSLPAVVAGGWLLLAPSRLTWAAAAELHSYDIGAARACAAGLIAAVVAVAWSHHASRPDPRSSPDSGTRAQLETSPEDTATSVVSM